MNKISAVQLALERTLWKQAKLTYSCENENCEQFGMHIRTPRRGHYMCGYCGKELKSEVLA